MFSLLTRSERRPCSRPSPLGRRRLNLERLEARDCPSGMGDGDTGLFVTFNYSQGPNRTVIIEGSVTEEDWSGQQNFSRGSGGEEGDGGEGLPGGPPGVAGATVTFSGVVQGNVVTGEDGTFSVTLPASALGLFRAQAWLEDGPESNVYEVELTNSAPVITYFSHYQGPGGAWVVIGIVSDEYAPMLTVTFTSSIQQINGQSTNVTYSNNFGLAFNIPAGSPGGTVTARVTDWWGVESAPAYTFILA